MLLFLLLLTPVLAQDGYYWKKFDGSIPTDAFLAGKDSAANRIYIGKGFFDNKGVAVGELFEFTPVIFHQYNGIWTNHKHIFILCTKEPFRLTWIATSAGSFDSDTKRYEKVIAGVEVTTSKKGYVYVGKIDESGDKIGKIFNPGEFYFYYFARDDEQKATAQYSVLVYDKNAIDIDVRQLAGQKSSYYFRDYNGTIPSDAFIGGIDTTLRNIYISQAYFKQGILVGELFENDRSIMAIDGAARAKPQSSNSAIMILCSDSLGSFAWVDLLNNTFSDVIKATRGKEIVVGGYSDALGDLLLGKIHENSTDIVGLVKVVRNKYIFEGLRGNRTITREEFALLTYDYWFEEDGGD